ncbi:MAG TPA: GvpL/GvpF family gas vesicle protein [Gemmatimonadaceae bacterium]|nr:GvpL/GvpF family gas vesicle protein [Gemmatimonadaceae bacterium]
MPPLLRAVPICLYGLILPRNTPRVPSGINGIDVSPTRVLACGPVAAIVSTIDGIPKRRDLSALRAHDAVLRAIAEAGITVAAVRFGQIFAGDADVCAEVAQRAESVVPTLERLDGCVEMRLILSTDVLPPRESAPSPEGGPGRAYLERLRSGSRITGVSLRDALGPAVRDERVEALRGAEGVTFAHLVHMSDVPTYRDAVAGLPMLSDAHVAGPLPLYSFSTAFDD